MYLTTVTTGAERREFNGPVLLPLWDGVDGFREGQIAYDADGIVDPDSGPSLIYWDGTQWLLIGSGDTSKWGNNNGFPDFPKIVPVDGTVPATLVQVLDQYTRTVISYSQATTKIGGGTITDADLGPIYIKNPATGTYYVRNWEGAVYPRWWGAKGDDATDDSVAWQAAINFAGPLAIKIDGEGKSYKIGNVQMTPETYIENAEFRLTAGVPGLYIGSVGQDPTAYLRNLTFNKVTFKGSCSYALIISTITGVSLTDVVFQNITASNDVFYLLNSYDTAINRLSFTGCTAGPGGACLAVDEGLNGVEVSAIYTSSFTDYGIRLTGGASVKITSPVIQGAVTGIYMTKARGIQIDSPYFENVVNPVVIDTNEADIDSIQIHNGYWGGPYSTHPQLAQNNGVMIKYVGGRNGVTVFGGKFDVSSSSLKKLASVGSSGVINLIRPQLSAASNTPQITDYLFKEPGALSTAGFYVEYTASANAYTTVRRTTDIGQEHIVENFDSGANLLRATWTPPNVGSAAATLTFYHIRVNAVSTGSLTLNTGQDVMRFNTTSAPLIVTLPITGVPTGKIFVVKKTAGANTLTVTCSGGAVTIDGSTSVIMTDIGETLAVQWDGALYIIIARGSTTTGIANQLAALQTANFAITGVGGASKFIASNPDSASFQQYYVLGRDPIDTTKFLWALGTTGIPTASGGPTGDAGQTLVLKSFTNTGSALADVMTFTRRGALTIPNGFTVTLGNITANAGSIQALAGSLYGSASLIHGGGFFQNTTTTVTGDYLAVSSDLYINVNNTAPCTITLPLISSGTAAGRIWYVKKISDNAFPVNITYTGTPFIDGATSPYVLANYNDSVMLHDNGASVFIYAKVQTPTLQSVAAAGNTYNGTITTSGMTNNGTFSGALTVINDGDTLGDYMTAIVNTSATAATVLLPNTSENTFYCIKRSDPANTLTVNTTSLDIFDDFSTSMVVTNAIIIQKQGNTWWVLSKF